MSLSLSPYVGGRRGAFAGAGLPVGFGARGGIGALGSPLLGRRYDPLARLGVGPHLGGVGAGALGIRGLNPLLARRDMLGGGYGLLSDPLLRGGRYPDLGGRGIEDLLLSSRLSHDPYRDLEALLGLGRFDRGRGYCDGRGCRGGLGCGYDRRCEYERCLYDCHRCSGGGSSSSSKDVKMKDIVVRGKTYKIRKSFLADSSKFETDIAKLLDKKSEEAMPNHVIQMLIDFINEEQCGGKTLLDAVSMNILASNLGVKSAVEFSLGLLKKNEGDYRIYAPELTQICLAVMESSKVDDKLVEWLKKYLKYDGRADGLGVSPYYQEILYRKPELGIHLEQLLGRREKDDNEDSFRIL